jgi:hypothetical protein
MNLRTFARLALSLILSFVLSLSAGAATSAPSGDVPLDAILRRLQATADLGHYRQVADAIAASPALRRQLEALASTGKLTEITLIAPEAAHAVHGVHFGAYLDGTRIVMTTALLKDLVPRHLFDFVTKDDVLPNNTTFVLGHLAHHLDTRPAVEARTADIRRRIDTEGNNPPPESGLPDEALRVHLDDEASALIQGWNDAVDAATTSNRRQVLRKAQGFSLLLNLRYMAIFLKASRQSAPLQMADDGRIAVNDYNTRALATALVDAQLIDVE